MAGRKLHLSRRGTDRSILQLLERPLVFSPGRRANLRPSNRSEQYRRRQDKLGHGARVPGLQWGLLTGGRILPVRGCRSRL